MCIRDRPWELLQSDRRNTLLSDDKTVFNFKHVYNFLNKQRFAVCSAVVQPQLCSLTKLFIFPLEFISLLYLLMVWPFPMPRPHVRSGKHSFHLESTPESTKKSTKLTYITSCLLINTIGLVKIKKD